MSFSSAIKFISVSALLLAQLKSGAIAAVHPDAPVTSSSDTEVVTFTSAASGLIALSFTTLSVFPGAESSSSSVMDNLSGSTKASISSTAELPAATSSLTGAPNTGLLSPSVTSSTECATPFCGTYTLDTTVITVEIPCGETAPAKITATVIYNVTITSTSTVFEKPKSSTLADDIFASTSSTSALPEQVSTSFTTSATSTSPASSTSSADSTSSASSAEVGSTSAIPEAAPYPVVSLLPVTDNGTSTAGLNTSTSSVVKVTKTVRLTSTRTRTRTHTETFIFDNGSSTSLSTAVDADFTETTSSGSPSTSSAVDSTSSTARLTSTSAAVTPTTSLSGKATATSGSTLCFDSPDHTLKSCSSAVSANRTTDGSVHFPMETLFEGGSTDFKPHFTTAIFASLLALVMSVILAVM